jgi:ubiquinone/menaquinone biosynthesis C-methylase UbiE
MEPTTAQHRAEMPQGTFSILERRTLSKDFRVLHGVVRPGNDVLDYGCASGAITADVAETVGPGTVVGADISEGLLNEARQLAAQRKLANLTFVRDDVYASTLERQFDVVASARMLQWLQFPAKAVEQMVLRVKTGGRLVLLDYNHLKATWNPEPPKSFLTFYRAFLEWRRTSGMDNEVGDKLADMMKAARLAEVTAVPQLETAARGESDFLAQIQIWYGVAESRGHQIVADGFLTETERQAASADYRAWIETAAQSQTLYLIGAVGKKA